MLLYWTLNVPQDVGKCNSSYPKKEFCVHLNKLSPYLCPVKKDLPLIFIYGQAALLPNFCVRNTQFRTSETNAYSWI